MILLIEDHPETSVALQRLLRMTGRPVVAVRTLGAARAVLETEPVRLIISDLHLPDGNALSEMRAIREKKPVSAIALSGSFPVPPEECTKAGFDECLQKPVTFADLIAAVDRVSKAKRNNN